MSGIYQPTLMWNLSRNNNDNNNNNSDNHSTWESPFVRFSGLLLQWTREELRRMDQRTRKLMTEQQTLNPSDIERLDVSRKECERALDTINGCIDSTIKRFGVRIKMSKERLIKVAKNSSRDRKRTNTRKHKFEKKKNCTDISSDTLEETWIWLIKGKLKRETESHLIPGQNNTKRKNYIDWKYSE